MSSNIPNFKDQNGKTIYQRTIVAALTNAVYADKTRCEVDGEVINILSSKRDKTSWDVVVAFE
jgi:hypothetical protein